MKKTSKVLYLLFIQILFIVLSAKNTGAKADGSLAMELSPLATDFSLISSPSSLLINQVVSEFIINQIELDITHGPINIKIDSMNKVTIESYNSDRSLGIYSDLDNSVTEIVISGSTNLHSVTVSGDSSEPINIILKNVIIAREGSVAGCAFALKNNAKVALHLSGDNKLVGTGNYGGLEVPFNTEITIGCLTVDDDSLVAGSTGSGAGIGGSSDRLLGHPYGRITINRGRIMAFSNSGAGIGSGGGAGNNAASDGEIIINGGTVTACSNGLGAGIGGGRRRAGGKITINGGIVTAYSCENGNGYGAGIGGGSDKSGGITSITGGIVYAYSSKNNIGYGAGIGGGMLGESGSIAIEGGTIVAHSSLGYISEGLGIGIGSKCESTTGDISITGGSVNAKGKNGIGSILPLPKNSESFVYLSSLATNPGVAEADVAGGSIDGIMLTDTPSFANYCIRDIKTDTEGMLYLWLPQSGHDEQTISLIINNKKYSATYCRNAGVSYSKTLDDTLLGDISITVGGDGVLKIGEELFADYSSLNVKSNLNFEWRVDSLPVSSERKLRVLPSYAGKAISLSVYSDDVAGKVESNQSMTIPYTVMLGEITCAEPGDSINMSTAYKNTGDSILISFELADLASANYISFSPESIENISRPGLGTIPYIVNGNDAEGGIILVDATFTHIDEIIKQNLTITPPVRGMVPELFAETGGELFNAIISWSDNPAVFAPSTVYFIEVELTAFGYGRFAADFILEINNDKAVFLSRNDNANTISFKYIFPATSPPVLHEICLSADAFTFIAGDSFELAKIEATVTYDDGTSELMTLENLSGAVFVLSSGVLLNVGSKIEELLDGMRVTVEYEGAKYIITQPLIVLSTPPAPNGNDNEPEDLWENNNTPSEDNGELQKLPDENESNDGDEEDLPESSDENEDSFENSDDVNEDDLSENTDDSEDGNDVSEEDLPESTDENKENPGDGSENGGKWPSSDYGEVSMNDSGGVDINKLSESNAKDLIIKKAASIEKEVNFKNDIPYLLVGNTVRVNLSDKHVQELINEFEDNILTLNLSSIKNTGRKIIEVNFESVPQISAVNIIFPTNVTLQMPVGILKELSKISDKFGIVWEHKGLNFKFHADGKIINWYDYSNPLLISAPKGFGGVCTVLLDEDGKVIPRSWHDNGRIYGKVYSPGSYSITNQIPIGFTDTGGNEFEDILNFLAARSIIYGVGDRKFEPDREIKFCELISMVIRCLNVTLPDGMSKRFFNDIPSDAYYRDAFIKAEILEIIEVAQTEAESIAVENVSYEKLYATLYSVMRFGNMVESNHRKIKPTDYAGLAYDVFARDGVNSISKSFLSGTAVNVSRMEAAKMVYEMMMLDAKISSKTFLEAKSTSH